MTEPNWPPRVGTAPPDDTTTPEEPADGPTAPVDEVDGTRPRPAAPLPPPATWGPRHEGPGSPAGSVRPPDTTGTVEADTASAARPRPSLGLVLLAAIVGAVLGTAATLALAQLAPGATPAAAPDVRAPVVEAPDGATADIASVADAVTPSVVRIDRIQLVDGIPTEEGLGSGVIYRSDGYIITNNHVVEGADELQVTLLEEERHTAQVIGTDPLTDLAVLRIDADGLPAINVRDDGVVIGETAVAIGAPFGLNTSITAGIVSGKDRSLEVPVDDGIISIPNIIQTDAAINPGNSGGALVDASGQLIGINTAILATMGEGGLPGGNIGIGFAISAAEAMQIAEILIEQGFVRHARLGIQGATLNPAIAHQRDIEGVERGVYVDQIQPGTGADDSDIQPGDIIVGAAGEDIRAMEELTAIIRQHEAGEELDLVVVRNGEEIAVTVTLGEWRP
jgi:putative serine protease PepD